MKKYIKERKYVDDEDIFCMTKLVGKSVINYSFVMESKLWRNAGPDAFELQETMLKSDSM